MAHAAPHPALPSPPGDAQLYRWFAHVCGRILRTEPDEAIGRMAARPHDFRDFLTHTGLIAWPGYFAARGVGTLDGNPHFSAWWARASERALLHQEDRDWLSDALEAAGIATSHLKGGVTAELLYPDSALRPMVDIDLLVPASAAETAARVLAGLGYRPATPTVPPWNFEWTFVHEERPPLDLHLALCPTHRVPWDGAPALLQATAAADVAAQLELHAQHALAHFAQHKGYLRPVQELDLVIWTTLGLPAAVPAALAPAAALWDLRATTFWGLSPRAWTPPPGAHLPALRALYQPHTWHPLPPPTRLRHRLLGLALSSRPRGWVRQLLHPTPR